MLDAGTGTIVNIASLAGKNGVEGGTAYCASKHAVLGFSKSLMLEVRKRGLRVVAICPGSVATPFMDKRRSEEHTSELQSQSNLVCRLLLEKKKKKAGAQLDARTVRVHY